LFSDFQTQDTRDAGRKSARTTYFREITRVRVSYGRRADNITLTHSVAELEIRHSNVVLSLRLA